MKKIIVITFFIISTFFALNSFATDYCAVDNDLLKNCEKSSKLGGDYNECCQSKEAYEISSRQNLFFYSFIFVMFSSACFFAKKVVLGD